MFKPFQRRATLALSLPLLVSCGVGKPTESKASLAEQRCAFADKNYELLTPKIKDFEKDNCPPHPNATKNQGCDTWYSWNDHTVGVPLASVETATINPAEDGGAALGVCGDGTPGHKTALVLKAYGFNDYGAGFGDYSGAPHGDFSAWDGFAFWVRVPQGTDPGMAFTINDTNTNGESYGAATRQCCGGQAIPAGTGGAGGAGGASSSDRCTTEKVPLTSCYSAQTDPTQGDYAWSWTVACKGYRQPAGSTCDAWKITPSLTKAEKDQGLDGGAIAAFPASDCSKSGLPAYAKARCDIFQTFSQPFICQDSPTTPITTPPASLCDGWHFLLQATTDGSWSFQTIPFDTLAQSGAGRVFPSFDSHNVSGLSSGVQGGGASIEFWLDEIDVYRAKK